MSNCSCCSYNQHSYYPPAHMHPYWANHEWIPSNVDPRTGEMSVRFVEGVFTRKISDVVWQYDKGLKIKLYGFPENGVDYIIFAYKDDPSDMFAVDAEFHPAETLEDETEIEAYYLIPFPNKLTVHSGEVIGYILREDDGGTTEDETDDYTVTVGILDIDVNERVVPNAPTPSEPTCEEKCDAMHAELLAQIEELKAQIEELKNTSSGDQP